MSIPNIFYKIKSKSDIDKNTFLYLFIIVGVGISAFGLGRLSIDNNINDIKNENIFIADINKLSENQYSNNGVYVAQPIEQKEKMYVASKNGKMYYSLGCSGAKRIKNENEIWFSTSEDAEKSGYIKASSC